jgi:hypothetical protein
MTEPVFEQLEHAWDAFTRHMPHHHPHGATMAPATQEAPVSLIDTIENELSRLEGGVSEAVHSVLAKHLALASVAAHVATETAVLAASPVGRIVETAAGLTAGEQAFIARAAADAAAWLADLSAPAAVATSVTVDVPLPEPAPAG